MTIAEPHADRLPRLWRRRGGLVTMATVVTLVAGLGLTVLGLGAADQAVASFDAASWAWSRGKGEVARINGVTARVDTRVDVPQARGHQLQISQTDRFVIMRDLTTGQVSSMDLTSLQIAETTATTAGLGVSVALQDDTAFVIDAVQGMVSQIDPRSLKPIGEPIRYPPGITGGAFDGEDRLWIAVPGEGTVSAIVPARLPSQATDADQGATAGPRALPAESVAPPSHDLAISTLDNGVAVLNRTTNELTTIRGKERNTVQLKLSGRGALPPRTEGAVVPVTVPDDRHVHVVADDVAGKNVTDDDATRELEVPGEGSRLRPAVAWQGFIYCADEQTGTVHVFDATGNLHSRISMKAAGGPLELEVRENHLFINAPDSNTARVVDDKHQVRSVDKYADDVLGGDPPPTPPDPPPPPPKPKPRKPVITKPGPPRNVRAEAGNAEARVSWRPAAANGAAITRYVVQGGGRTFQVGAEQRSLLVTGLTNGESYEFAVHAVNVKGAGPSRTSNSVRPTAEVPDAPAQVTAEARPDGTVAVRWAAANGQGLKIKRYAVTAISDGSSVPIGDPGDKTELVLPDGELEYGKQYAFSVVAVNERGAGSKPSPVSATVVPFTKPGAPPDVDAATVGAQKGSIEVAWGPAVDNGRPVTKYLVQAGGRTTEVTNSNRTALSGFGNGENVAVQVRAVNEAGEGEPGTATASTLAAPKVTVTGSSATTTAVTVTFTVDAGGGQATCKLEGGGGTPGTGNCSSLTVSDLNPSEGYTFTVTATNPAGAGTATRQQATDDVFGIATCRNGESGDTATYCSRERPGERNGNELFWVTEQDDDRQAGWVPNKTRLKAFCKKNGAKKIDSYIYNSQKVSTWWIQVDFEKKRPYIPYAWLNLEGGDAKTFGILPTCK